ncbi:hypothetical protein GEMRC1_003536 [Eukaryota sp. GEM-RC1]
MSSVHQIIDGEGNFTNQLESFCTSCSKLSSKYTIVSVLGAQSSGKSTLLNCLFNTSFPELNSNVGRRQTTLGLWMAQPQNVQNILVMDSEGTDGRERGDQLVYERRFALFSLVLSNILIVNLWHNDIGRHNASNLSLLRSVLDANARLFLSNSASDASFPKRKIIFAIRDHIESATSLTVLERDLVKDIHKLWEDVAEKNELTIPLETLFEFHSFGFPHKIIQEVEFNSHVDEFLTFLTSLSTGVKASLPIDGLFFVL